MNLPFIPMPTWSELRDLIVKTRDRDEELRARIILMVETKSQREAAKKMGIPLARVQQTVKLFKKGGVDALRTPSPPTTKP